MSIRKARSLSLRSRSGGGTLLGIFFGIMLGALIAAGAAWYFMRSNPFQTANLQRPTTQPATTTAPANPVSLPGRPGGTPVEKPELDFYKILPQDGSQPDKAQAQPQQQQQAQQQQQQAQQQAQAKLQQQQAQMQAEQQQKIASAILEGRTPPEAKPASDRFYLQLGAFGSNDEADNLKARLAFMGIESSSQRVQTPDKGTLNRVRVGPFNSPEEMNRVRAQLAQSGMSASIVKVKAGD